jgi:A/G-specific adenine glycosylase
VKGSAGPGRARAAGPRRTRESRAALLAWYRAERRDLPWRRTRDPYAIWVSETMLQQTRVETAIPYYERFLERFPHVGALATADLDDVLGSWAGLGYYGRARNLKAAAEQVVERFGGRLPEDPDALLTLPGVGRYTAGAVASIAFDRPAPVVDGNVARVLARVLAIAEPIEQAAVRARLWEEAEALVRGTDPGALNQALMELGARICTPRAPRCPACPLGHRCEARERGAPEAFPVRLPKRRPQRIRAVAALVSRRHRILAVQRPARGLLGGLWELPGGEVASRCDARTLARTLRARIGLSITGARRVGELEHLFSHRRLRLQVYRCEAAPGRVRLDGFDRHRWVTPAAFSRLPIGSATRRALALALEA